MREEAGGNASAAAVTANAPQSRDWLHFSPRTKRVAAVATGVAVAIHGAGIGEGIGIGHHLYHRPEVDSFPLPVYPNKTALNATKVGEIYVDNDIYDLYRKAKGFLNGSSVASKKIADLEALVYPAPSAMGIGTGSVSSDIVGEPTGPLTILSADRGINADAEDGNVVFWDAHEANAGIPLSNDTHAACINEPGKLRTPAESLLPLIDFRMKSTGPERVSTLAAIALPHVEQGNIYQWQLHNEMDKVAAELGTEKQPSEYLISQPAQNVTDRGAAGCVVDTDMNVGQAVAEDYGSGEATVLPIVLQSHQLEASQFLGELFRQNATTASPKAAQFQTLLAEGLDVQIKAANHVEAGGQITDAVVKNLTTSYESRAKAYVDSLKGASID